MYSKQNIRRNTAAVVLVVIVTGGCTTGTAMLNDHLVAIQTSATIQTPIQTMLADPPAPAAGGCSIVGLNGQNRPIVKCISATQ